MINKKLKYFLQKQMSNQRHSTMHTMLKLKALQKSKQKHKQRNQSHTKPKDSRYEHHQSYNQFNLSTRQQTNKDKYNNMNSKIKQLQQKVSILFDESKANKYDTPQKANRKSNLKTEKSGDMSRQRISTQKGNSNDNYLTLKRQNRNSNEEYHIQSIKNYETLWKNQSFLTLKLQACKLLSKFQQNPQQISYFDGTNTQQEVFNTIYDMINKGINKKTKAIQQQNKLKLYRNQAKMQEQNQLFKRQYKNLILQVSQLQIQKDVLKEKNKQSMKIIQQQITQIYQLKLLNEETQKNLIKVNIQNNQLLKKINNIKLQYETKIYRQINQNQKKQLKHTQLKQILAEHKNKSKQLQIHTKMLNDDIDKWERDYTRLMERYEIQKLEKRTLQQQRDNQVSSYYQSKKLMTEGYISLIQKLNEQLNDYRQAQDFQQLQINQLKNKLKLYQSKTKDIQTDYLCLNEDYTRDVKEWLNKQQYFERTTHELRRQLSDAHETIAQYSKILSTYAKKSSVCTNQSII